MKIGSFESQGNNANSVIKLPNEIYFSSDINEENINDLINSLSNLDASLLDYEYISNLRFYSIPIVLFFSTSGGNVDDALRFISFVRMFDRKIFIVADSLIASSGVYIYLSFPKENRLSTPFSYFMIHDVRIIMPEFTNIKDAMINTQQLYEKLKEILESYILKDIQISDKFSWEPGKTFSADVYLSLNEAVERNLVHKVVKNKGEIYFYINSKGIDLIKVKESLFKSMYQED
jgi:ATP-dependent protease ClpP protease subunit